MKRIMAAAAFAVALCSSGYAQTPEGVYLGTFSATTNQLNQQKGIKQKDLMILAVQPDGQVSFEMQNGGAGTAEGMTGAYHGYYLNLDEVVASVVLHFGKDYKTVKGSIKMGAEAGDGGICGDATISLKRIEPN